MYQPENANPETNPKTANISISPIVLLQCHEANVFRQCKNSRCKSIAANMPEKVHKIVNTLVLNCRKFLF